MSLADIVNVTISASTVGITQAGFGIPLILSANASWPSERIRFYSSLVGVASDFAATTPEYLAAARIFSQSPHPVQIAIGRLANKPTQHWTITPVVHNSTDYKIRIGANTVTYTSDASATDAEIAAGLIALVNALTGDTLTASGTTTLALTGDSAGAWNDVEVLDPTLLVLAQDHADPGVAADLTAIKLIDDSWYGIINPYNSKAMALAISVWTEANGKFFIGATQDTECITVAEGSATDVMKTAKDATYFRSAFFYHPSNGAFLDAGLAGRVLPIDPGKETWAFKTVVGVSQVTLTETQLTNLKNKNGNAYQKVNGVNITKFGKMAAGEWIDVIRFRDWLIARMQENIFRTLLSNDKIPYIDDGVQLIAGNVRATLKEGKDVGGLDSYSVAVGKVKDANPTDKQNRELKLVNFASILAGAIHAAYINGTVTN
jgi:hypothetical protein